MLFPATNWQMLADATLSGDEAGQQALEHLCKDYYRPVVAFLRARAYEPQDAEDFAQQFFLELMESRAWRAFMRSNFSASRV